MGVRTRLIGRVGDDEFGSDYVKHLDEEGVVTDLIDNVNVSTGLAHIMVASSGENCIIIVPGLQMEKLMKHLSMPITTSWLTRGFCFARMRYLLTAQLLVLKQPITKV